METFNIVFIKPITSAVSKGFQMISSTNEYQSIKEFGVNQYNALKGKLSNMCNNSNSIEDNNGQENSNNNNIIINGINGIKTKVTNFFTNNNNNDSDSDNNSFNIMNPFSNIFNIKLTHLRGLINIGSTCYMNSILQCFAHIPELHNYFKKDKISNISIQLYDQNCLFFPIFREVIMELWNTSNNAPFEPKKFKQRLGEMNPLFQGPYPNDAKDLLTFILMQLHEELNNPKNSNINNGNYNNNTEIQKNKKVLFSYFKTFFMNSYRSIISDLFYGIIYSKYQCQNCNRTFYNYQLFNFFIFPLEKVLNYKMMVSNYNNNFNNTVSIDDCFQYSQSTSYLNDYYCNCCNRQTNCSFTTYSSVLPNIIIIILNRGVGIQFDIKITFEENIQLKKYVEFLSDECMYELIGVVTHYGESSANGHFISRCISPIDGKWYSYNDAIVNEIGFFNKNEFYGGHPYILFYKKFNLSK